MRCEGRYASELENFEPLHRPSLLRMAELPAFLQMAHDEIGSRTHVELWNENDLIAKALAGARSVTSLAIVVLLVKAGWGA
jgi:hypothetical protein